MKIAVIGTGYVGIVAGACWANVGHKVTCVDIDAAKIAMLSKGISPIFEPDLEDRITAGLREKTLHFTTDITSAVRDSEVSIIAVGTPSDPDGAFNSRYVLGAAKAIGDACRGLTDPRYVVIRSTINTDIFKEVRDLLAEHSNISVVSCPEFLAQGTAVRDFERPDRVVIGADTEQALQTVRSLYTDFVVKDERIFMMDPASAIMVKITSNNLLYNRISAVNEVARVCDATGADWKKVRLAVGADHRIGYEFLHAGPGVGGSCFGKDNRDLSALATRKGLALEVLSNVDSSNTQHKHYFAESVIAPYYDIFSDAPGLQGRTLGVWGLAFKANTDDMREAASITILHDLIKRGARIRAHDPAAIDRARQEFTALGITDRIQYCTDKYDAVTDADGLVVLTEWPIYKNPDYPELKERLKQPVIFDGRAILKREDVLQHGIVHYAMGRGFAYPR
ncbi:TPA: UDP-glucose/GDP-mannose dehydrogenase family protein [Candidatus Woesearchaeota archaeon]|nr:UDP-glucose/GDP-mannose dehydrogenase family protein [Candidatus Woesearchaeota archaeon]